MLNIHPPFVVSVAVLIIDIHESRDIRESRDFISGKTPPTYKGRFYRNKITARDVLSTI